MSSDMPDWLAGLVSAPEDEEDAQPSMFVTSSPADAAPRQDAAVQPIEGVLEDEDIMADLRSQVAVAETPSSSASPRRKRSRYMFGLLPWQRFVLSVLMFLDIAFIGILFLIMLGRIVLP